MTQALSSALSQARPRKASKDDKQSEEELESLVSGDLEAEVIGNPIGSSSIGQENEDIELGAVPNTTTTPQGAAGDAISEHAHKPRTQSIVSQQSVKPAAPEQAGLSFTAMLALCFLVVQNSAAVLVMRYTLVSPGEREYLTPTAVVMGEVLKTITSFSLVMLQEGTLAGIWADKAELLKTSVPAVLYLVQNNLQYVAVQNLQAATFQILYQLKILTTAVFWVVFFRQELGRQKWVGLWILMTGVVVVRSAEASAGSTTARAGNVNVSVGLAAVVASSITSGLAGVYFEKLLKGSSNLTVWQRNGQLGAYSVVIGLLGLAMSPTQRARILDKGFFQGYTLVTCVSVLIQGGGGLLIGVVMKYANVILKDIATALSIILSCILSVAFLGEEVGKSFMLGTVLVISGVWVFSHAHASK